MVYERSTCTEYVRRSTPYTMERFPPIRGAMRSEAGRHFFVTTLQFNQNEESRSRQVRHSQEFTSSPQRGIQHFSGRGLPYSCTEPGDAIGTYSEYICAPLCRAAVTPMRARMARRSCGTCDARRRDLGPSIINPPMESRTDAGRGHDF